MAWWRRRSTPEPAEPRDELAARPGESDRDHVTRLAEHFLPEEHRAAWLGLLRPAVGLRPAGAGEPVVARLGGRPRLPPDVAWPEWPGHGPLAYVGEVDLAALTGFELDLVLPTEGRLLLFYYDAPEDTVVGYFEPGSVEGGTRLWHVTEPGAARAAPDGVPVYDEVRLTGVPVVSAPSWEHPVLAAAFGAGLDHDAFMEHPVNDEQFTDLLHDRWDEARHQVGGHALPIQGPVEWEAAMAVSGSPSTHDPALDVEAARWSLLVQVDSEVELGMMWGDVGTLYWLARPADLAAGDLTQPSFTWQC